MGKTGNGIKTETRNSRRVRSGWLGCFKPGWVLSALIALPSFGAAPEVLLEPKSRVIQAKRATITDPNGQVYIVKDGAWLSSDKLQEVAKGSVDSKAQSDTYFKATVTAVVVTAIVSSLITGLVVQATCKPPKTAGK